MNTIICAGRAKQFQPQNQLQSQPVTLGHSHWESLGPQQYSDVSLLLRVKQQARKQSEKL